MPELPDVEVFKRYLDATALHQTITTVEIKRQEILDDAPQTVRDELTGRQFASTRRHGKYLLAALDNELWLALHFGMTGRLQYFKDIAQDPPHDRLLVHFDNGYHLAYDCQRLLGHIRLVEAVDPFLAEKDLGPDALDIPFDQFAARVTGRRGMIKSALMNQQALAGIGNVYSDEMLFQARLHPRTKAKLPDDATRRRLFEAMRDVLQTAIDCQADPAQFPDTWLTPHREPGAPCPGCDGQVARIEISGRGAYYCPACQQKG